MRIIIFLMISAAAISSCQNKSLGKTEAQGYDVSESDKTDLAAAEKKMFSEIIKFGDYWKTDIDDDYLTIDADGSMHTKSEVISKMDSTKKKMFEVITDTRLSERKVRKYGDLAIINGQADFMAGNTAVASVYYTEIWHRKNNKWYFNGWQGTSTKQMQEVMMKGIVVPK